MQKDLGAYRKSYEKSALLEANVADNPMELFEQWFKETEQSKLVEEPNAMTIATIGLDGYPKSRVVLLKEFSEVGFVFYTNYHSEKGKALAENPQVCLSFFWPELERQIIIKGNAEKLDHNISDAYFNSRPKGSQLGALASNQSTVIPSRDYLEDKLHSLEEMYDTRKIERPENWGGYLIRPASVEFWQGRPNRLHDRILYTPITNKSWQKDRLAP